MNTLESFLHLTTTLYNKEVILCGGSPRINNLSTPSRFFHIQLNHHILKRPQTHCDWLFARPHSPMNPDTFKTLPLHQKERIKYLSTALDVLPEQAIQWASISELTQIPFLDLRYSRENPYSPQLSFINSINQSYNSMPLLGMLALEILLKLPLSKIYLIGFDFYTSEDGAFLQDSQTHDFAEQFQRFLFLYNTDFRIQVEDSKLLKLINKHCKQRGILATSTRRA